MRIGRYIFELGHRRLTDEELGLESEYVKGSRLLDRAYELPTWIWLTYQQAHNYHGVE